MNPSFLSNILNLLRWIAATMVVIGHLRSFLFVDYSSVLHHTILTKLFYLITGFGHQAVIVFFVLSGYLVGGSVINRYKNNKIDRNYVKLYLIKRFTRIYIVLIPALLIGYALDLSGIIYFSDLYNNFYHISAMNNNVLDRLDTLNLLGNIFNLQTILVSTLGSNGPLWSLANEWWYYILFILLFINNKMRVVAIFLLLILLFTNVQLLIYSLIWLVGASLVLIDKRVVHWIISLGLFIIYLFISRKFSGVYIDFGLAILLALFINSITFIQSNVNLLFFKINKILADFSFSLYLFHFPFFVFMISIFYFNGMNMLLMQPSGQSFLYYFIYICIIYMYAYIMYLLFESKTKKVQNYLIKYFINKDYKSNSIVKIKEKISISKVYSIFYLFMFISSLGIAFIKGFDPLIANYSYLLIFLIFIVYIISIYRVYIIKKQLLGIMMTSSLYFFYCYLTSFWSILPDRSTIYSLNQLVFMFVLFVFPLLLLQNKLLNIDKIHFKQILLLINISLLLFLLYSFVYFYIILGFSPLTRFGGIYLNANMLGNIIFIFLISTHLYYKRYGKMKFLIFFALIFLVLTQSRNFMLASMVYFLIINIYNGYFKKIFYGILLVIPIMIVLFTIRTESSGGNELSTSGKEISRPLIWVSALNYAISNDKIILGTGFETGYEVTYNTIVGKLWGAKAGVERSGSSLHSSIIKIIVTTGIMGFILFILFIYQLVKYFSKVKDRQLKGISIALILSPLVSDLFNVNYWGALGSVSTIVYFLLLFFLIGLVQKGGTLSE